MRPGPGSFPMLFTASVMMLHAVSCAITTKPCSTRGDVGWVPELKGDQICYQQVRKDGTFVNHGAYKRLHKNRKVALEGQFVNGLKQGIWAQYDEDGKMIRERYFEKGIEKAVAMSKDSGNSKPGGDTRAEPGIRAEEPAR